MLYRWTTPPTSWRRVDKKIAAKMNDTILERNGSNDHP